MKGELRRQFIHFLFGSFFIALIAVFGTEYGLWTLSTLLVLGLIVSLAIKKGYPMPVMFQIMEKVERSTEKRLPGKAALLFFLSAIITILVFQQQNIVLGALCVAVFGDAASTVFGLRFGKHRIAGKKTLEGTIGGILVSFFFLLFLFQWQIALLAAAIGMLAELLPLDDNFTIPIAAGAMLRILI